MNRFAIIIAVACIGIFSARAEAQLSSGQLRISVDGDVLSIAGVERDPEGPGGESEIMVVGFGPNHVGGALFSAAPTPIGIGVDYVLQPRLMLGVRAALGFDVVSPDGNADNTRVLGLSLMPRVTFVPLGNNRAKMFVSGSPILQVDRAKTDDFKERTLLGGFGLGIGALIFFRDRLSADVGFHFEGRFGNYDRENDPDVHVRDLRGVIRVGLSFWR
jgi:hypothetical protein